MNRKIEFVVIDIDGTMTDGSIYYDEKGNEIKKFNTRDAAGFFALKKCGIKIIILTGRKSIAAERRMNELKVDYLFQNVSDKKSFLTRFASEKGINLKHFGYIGDDLNDYAAMKNVGFVACPRDACKEVKAISDYVSNKKGGDGVVRDVAEHILKKVKLWDKIIEDLYFTGC